MSVSRASLSWASAARPVTPASCQRCRDTTRPSGTADVCAVGGRTSAWWASDGTSTVGAFGGRTRGSIHCTPRVQRWTRTAAMKMWVSLFTSYSNWNELCFRPRCYIVWLFWGRGQPGLMKWILECIIPQMQDRSFNTVLQLPLHPTEKKRIESGIDNCLLKDNIRVCYTHTVPMPNSNSLNDHLVPKLVQSSDAADSSLCTLIRLYTAYYKTHSTS